MEKNALIVGTIKIMKLVGLFHHKHRPFDVVVEKKFMKRRKIVFSFSLIKACRNVNMIFQFNFFFRRVEGLACTRKEINDNHTLHRVSFLYPISVGSIIEFRLKSHILLIEK